MTVDLSRELDVARTTAIEAGRLIMQVYATAFDVVEKAHGEGPVTEADKRANEHIVNALHRAFPTDGVIAEESKHNLRIGASRCWFVDPLDGTREFVARNGEFAVHIGLAIEGFAALGVVYRPVGEKLYAGTVDGGTTLSESGVTRNLRVSEISDPSKLRLLISRSHRSVRTEEIRVAMGVHEVIECGSVGLKCGLVAEGVADLYLHASGKSSRWDSCAPEAILRGAGGRLTDLFGKPYRYDGTELLNPRGLIGCNAAAFDAVLPVVARVIGGKVTE